MTLSGNVDAHDWTVSAEVEPVRGGFGCLIRVAHSEADGKFEHAFRHFKVFPTEREAVLDGLHEGMLWIEGKVSKRFTFRV